MTPITTIISLIIFLTSSAESFAPFQQQRWSSRRCLNPPAAELSSRLGQSVKTSSSSSLVDNGDDVKNDMPTNRFAPAPLWRGGGVRGPPMETKPNYEEIVGPLGKQVDHLFMSVFRTELVRQVGFDSDRPKTDYQGIIEVAFELNRRYSDRVEIQRRAQETLRALFPSWLPGSYAKLFSKPFPEFSARMNAWATWWAGTWLMGECEVNDIVLDDVGTIGKQQGLLVKRCRFLEESGCASVCVNSCKIPTQNFFSQDMGLPLTMEPNYETFECQFSFGKMPSKKTELEAVNTPCLMRCPTAGALREWHTRSNNITIDIPPPMENCHWMENKD